MALVIDTFSVAEVLDELRGRLTYRQFDHWCRNGAILLRMDGHGQGSRRMIFEDERFAIHMLVERYEKVQAELSAIRSGRAFLEFRDQ